MSVEIPSQCQTCPVACGLKDRAANFSMRADRLISQSVGDTPERVADYFQEASAQYGIDTTGSVLEPQEIAATLREAGGVAVEALEEKARVVERKITDLTADCQGPLGMRAVRDGMQYTVKICTSPGIAEGVKDQPASVTRKPLS